MGLENRLNDYVGLLSGGQRQALTLLMATLKKPKLLLLDEHTAALDPKTAAKVLEITDKIVKRDNLTTLMITHNMKDAIRYGNRLIMMKDGQVVYLDENENWVAIPDNTPVSMNVWGFTPDYFEYSEKRFVEFLQKDINTPKSEYFIPIMVNDLIRSKKATLKVLDTTSVWFGVTYSEDRPGVVERFASLAASGEYPSKLF